VGIAPNRMLAKICSDRNKPDGEPRLRRLAVARLVCAPPASPCSLAHSARQLTKQLRPPLLPPGQHQVEASREAVMAFMRDLPIRHVGWGGGVGGMHEGA
jgi:uncharacterized heparinase superfamily protein